MSSCDKVVFLASRCTAVSEILNLKRFALHNRWQPESTLMFFGSVSDVMVFFFFKASISRRESRAKEKESNLDAARLAFRRRLPARCYRAKSETTTLSSLRQLHNQKPT